MKSDTVVLLVVAVVVAGGVAFVLTQRAQTAARSAGPGLLERLGSLVSLGTNRPDKRGAGDLATPMNTDPALCDDSGYCLQ